MQRAATTRLLEEKLAQNTKITEEAKNEASAAKAQAEHAYVVGNNIAEKFDLQGQQIKLVKEQLEAQVKKEAVDHEEQQEQK
jgi:hypothetical protein